MHARSRIVIHGDHPRARRRPRTALQEIPEGGRRLHARLEVREPLVHPARQPGHPLHVEGVGHGAFVLEPIREDARVLVVHRTPIDGEPPLDPRVPVDGHAVREVSRGGMERLADDAACGYPWWRRRLAARVARFPGEHVRRLVDVEELTCEVIARAHGRGGVAEDGDAVIVVDFCHLPVGAASAGVIHRPPCRDIERRGGGIGAGGIGRVVVVPNKLKRPFYREGGWPHVLFSRVHRGLRLVHVRATAGVREPSVSTDCARGAYLLLLLILTDIHSRITTTTTETLNGAKSTAARWLRQPPSHRCSPVSLF
mmetsp:Transcript_24150/g.45166  ORF Transcript_24150/g.45166 Transcript_24150/m.45166 type:complete len:312 (-) Transcript_24150:269-1204(-)